MDSHTSGHFYALHVTGLFLVLYSTGLMMVVTTEPGSR